MEKLLICGDSFSCPGTGSWSNLLGYQFNITNLSQAGSSEYRIWKNWQQQKLSNYDIAIVCHTSSNRIYSENNFFYNADSRHNHCDLLYLDVKSKLPLMPAQHITWFFENVFDIEHATLNHELLINKWVNTDWPIPVLHITFFDTNLPQVCCFFKEWQQYSGNINHLTAQGNIAVGDLILQQINILQGAWHGRSNTRPS